MLPALLVVGQTIKPPGRLLLLCSASPWRHYLSFCWLSCMSLLLLLSRQHTQPTWVRYLWKRLTNRYVLHFHPCQSSSTTRGSVRKTADRPHLQFSVIGRSATPSDHTNQQISEVLVQLRSGLNPIVFPEIFVFCINILCSPICYKLNCITHLYSLVLSLLVSVGGV